MTDFLQPGWSSRLTEQVISAFGGASPVSPDSPCSLLRVTVAAPASLADADPWAVARGLGDRGRDHVRFLWHRDTAASGDSRGATIAGVGEAITLEPDHFDSAADAVRDLRARTIAVGEPAGKLPLAVGGFAFAAGQTGVFHGRDTEASTFRPDPASLWSSWPRAALIVPAVMLCRLDGRLTITVQVAVAGGASPRSVVAEAIARLEGVAAVRPREPHAVSTLRGNTIDFDAFDSPGARDAWIANVSDARDAIRRGDLRKVVVARPVDLTPAPLPPVDLAFTLRRTQPGCTTFLISNGNGNDCEAFVGATPELLVDLRGLDLHTTALAGTRQRNGGAGPGARTGVGRPSLLDSAKDTVEQEVVTETIHDALQPLCETFGPTSERRLARFTDVSHIETPLSGRLREPVGIFRLLDALHPTPAVGGAPRDAALDWIANHETFDRGWYAGPVGWVTPDADGCFAVAIRSALVRADGVHAFAGCGIVGDSDPVAEWEETRWKLRTIAGVVLAHLPQHERPTVPVQQ